VYHAIPATTTLASESYVVKHVPKHVQQDHVPTEAHVHTLVSKLPHVLPLLEASLADSPTMGFYLITPYCDAQDLYSFVSKGGIRNEIQGKSVLVQIIKAVLACHSIGVYHRDLKMENILLKQKNGQLIAYVSDFGLATMNRYNRDAGCGSLVYMPPEAVLSLQLSKKLCRRTCELPLLDAAKHDTWSITQLAINLLLQVNAWHVADVQQDACFKFYVQDTTHNLASYLPVTAEFERCLVMGFELDWQSRCDVTEFYESIMKCERFRCRSDEWQKRKKQFYDTSKCDMDSGVDV
jgi:serine/threonine protein kinase